MTLPYQPPLRVEPYKTSHQLLDAEGYLVCIGPKEGLEALANAANMVERMRQVASLEAKRPYKGRDPISEGQQMAYAHGWTDAMELVLTELLREAEAGKP